MNRTQQPFQANTVSGNDREANNSSSMSNPLNKLLIAGQGSELEQTYSPELFSSIGRATTTTKRKIISYKQPPIIQPKMRVNKLGTIGQKKQEASIHSMLQQSRDLYANNYNNNSNYLALPSPKKLPIWVKVGINNKQQMQMLHQQSSKAGPSTKHFNLPYPDAGN